MNVKNRSPDIPAPDLGVEALVWLLLALIGACGLWLAGDWPMGRLGRPGPGAFAALILGLLTVLACLRLAVLVQAHRLILPQPARMTDHGAWKLMAAPLAFAVLIGPAGFLAASLASTGLGAMAVGKRPVRAILIAVVLTALIFLVFRFGLSVPLDWRGSWMR